MIVDALVVAGTTLAVGVLAGALLRTLSSVRLQLAALALLAVVLPLGAVLLSGAVMLHIGAEGEVVAVSVAAGAVSLAMALVLTRQHHRSARTRARSLGTPGRGRTQRKSTCPGADRDC